MPIKERRDNKIDHAGRASAEDVILTAACLLSKNYSLCMEQTPARRIVMYQAPEDWSFP
jgi:hypothetical protein